ncbi:DUF3572 domain-containing protein [Roseivivax marinus]|uniref:DUF3572 domain-containing protein n=1 Tax=Roseivivax marinus TaxID=1379903 RepID=UPI001F042314|nr:DUF3572 domain-containing protein [Roseivivax marinus]UMA65325.1 DUF3572 domain-containing protein [Roseivivax marinus]
MQMTQDRAETVGLTAVAWLAANDELLPVFMGSTGIDEAAIRENIADPTFHAAVLDFLLMDDAWVVRFCDESGLDYEVPGAAREALPGGGAVHWT